ncbi:hypothetical protein Emag_007203 [Eimeria magna]
MSPLPRSHPSLSLQPRTSVKRRRPSQSPFPTARRPPSSCLSSRARDRLGLPPPAPPTYARLTRTYSCPPTRRRSPWPHSYPSKPRPRHPHSRSPSRVHVSPPPSPYSRSRSFSPTRSLPLASVRGSGTTRLSRWRERQLDRLPRLDELPHDYKQLADFLDAIESYVANHGSPADLPELAMGQMSNSVQRLLRQFARTAYPGQPITFENMISAFIHTLVHGDPEAYVRKSLAQLDRFARSPTMLHVHLSDCYDTYLDLCRRFRVRPHLDPRLLVDTFLSHLPSSLRRRVEVLAGADWAHIRDDIHRFARLVQQAERCTLPSHVAATLARQGQRPPMRTPGAALRHPRSTPQRTTIHLPARYVRLAVPEISAACRLVEGTPAPYHQPSHCPAPLSRPTPGPGPATGRSHATLLLLPGPRPRPRHMPGLPRMASPNPARARLCPACRSSGRCPPDCFRRLSYARSNHAYLELDRDGRSYFVRADVALPKWYRDGMLVGRLTPSATVAHVAAANGTPRPKTILTPDVDRGPGPRRELEDLGSDAPSSVSLAGGECPSVAIGSRVSREARGVTRNGSDLGGNRPMSPPRVDPGALARGSRLCVRALASAGTVPGHVLRIGPRLAC